MASSASLADTTPTTTIYLLIRRCALHTNRLNPPKPHLWIQIQAVAVPVQGTMPDEKFYTSFALNKTFSLTTIDAPPDEEVTGVIVGGYGAEAEAKNAMDRNIQSMKAKVEGKGKVATFEDEEATKTMVFKAEGEQEQYYWWDVVEKVVGNQLTEKLEGAKKDWVGDELMEALYRSIP